MKCWSPYTPDCSRFIGTVVAIAISLTVAFDLLLLMIDINDQSPIAVSTFFCTILIGRVQVQQHVAHVERVEGLHLLCPACTGMTADG